MKGFLIAVFGFLVAGCSQHPAQPTIPDEKMARVMADMCLSEAATNGLGGFPKDSLMQIYFKQTLEMHGLTVEEYERNLRLYADDLPRMQLLTKQIEALLTAEKK